MYNIQNLIWTMLPPFLRKPLRVYWLMSLLKPIDDLMQGYLQFKQGISYKISINAQVIVFENYINKILDPEAKRIKIIHAVDGAIPIGLEIERSYFMSLSTSSEGKFKPIPLFGENDNALDVSFNVIVPLGVNIAKLKSEINIYKPAGKTYKIIQS